MSDTEAAPDAIWRTAYRHPSAWDAAFPPLSLTQMFEDAARREGDAPLIVDYDFTL